MIEIFCAPATARVLSKYDPAKGIYFLALVHCNSNKEKKTCCFFDDWPRDVTISVLFLCLLYFVLFSRKLTTFSCNQYLMSNNIYCFSSATRDNYNLSNCCYVVFIGFLYYALVIVFWWKLWCNKLIGIHLCYIS